MTRPAALSCLRHRGLRAAAMLRAPQPSLADPLRRIRPPPLQPAAFRGAARPIRQLPDPRQAPARRPACTAAACPTSPEISGRLRRGACAASALRPRSLWPFDALRPGPPTPGSAPSSRPTPCSLRPFAALSRLRHRGPRAASMLQAPQPSLADRSPAPHPPTASQPAAFRRAVRPVRQLQHPRQAPPAALPAKPQPVRRPQHRGRLRPSTTAATIRRPPASRIASAQAPAGSRTAAAPAPPRRPSTRAAKFGIIAGGTAPSRRARHRVRDDATARRRGSAMAPQRGGGTAACAARPAAPAQGRRRVPPQPGSSQTSRGETP